MRDDRAIFRVAGGGDYKLLSTDLALGTSVAYTKPIAVHEILEFNGQASIVGRTSETFPNPYTQGKRNLFPGFYEFPMTLKVATIGTFTATRTHTGGTPSTAEALVGATVTITVQSCDVEDFSTGSPQILTHATFTNDASEFVPTATAQGATTIPAQLLMKLALGEFKLKKFLRIGYQYSATGTIAGSGTNIASVAISAPPSAQIWVDAENIGT